MRFTGTKHLSEKGSTLAQAGLQEILQFGLPNGPNPFMRYTSIQGGIMDKNTILKRCEQLKDCLRNIEDIRQKSKFVEPNGELMGLSVREAFLTVERLEFHVNYEDQEEEPQPEENKPAKKTKKRGPYKKKSKEEPAEPSDETKYFIVGDESKHYTLKELKEYLHVYHSHKILEAVEKGTGINIDGDVWYIDEVKEAV